MAMENEAADPYLEEYAYDSMFGPAEVFTVETAQGQPLRLLYVDGGFQSATYLGEQRFVPPFRYCRAFDQLFQLKPDAKRILLIGGGAFSYPKHALMTYPGISMDVVEIDPVIIDIARKHFFLDEVEQACAGHLQSFACDGMDFLRQAQEGIYDVVINDSFAGTVGDAPLLSEEGLGLSRRCMVEDGVYLLNAVAQNADDVQDYAALDAVRHALSGSFEHVHRQAVEDEEFVGCVNHVFMATNSHEAATRFTY